MYYSFDAYFSGKRVIIKGKEYKLCEILMCYLTAKTKDLQDTYYKCCRYVDVLHYPENDIEQIQSRKFFQTAIDFYLSIEKLMRKFPPYEKLKGNVLSNILNCHQILFKDSKTEDDEDFYEFEEFIVFDASYHRDMGLSKDIYEELSQLNNELTEYAECVRDYIGDLIRVKKAFEPFLDMIHSKHKFPNEHDLATLYTDFNNKYNTSPFTVIAPSGTMTMKYGTVSIGDETIFCECYSFSSIGGFLYIELFKGLKEHYIPRRCGNCNKYFLMEGGYYSDYCTRIIPGQVDTVCRDLGHRKNYNDKIKNDPVWSVYSKAYKAHYARRLKGKMTPTEFAIWADYAIMLRDRTLAGKMDYDKFCKEIKK